MNENDSATGQTGAPYPQGAPGPQGAAGPQGAPGPQGAATPGLQQFFATIRRQGIVRTEDRWFGGVAGGIARRLGIDVTVVRGLLALTLLVSGAGFVVYALAWVLLPEEKDGRIHAEETLQGRFDGAVLGAGLAFVLGITWGGQDWLGWNEGAWFNALVWIAVNVAIIGLVWVAVRDHQRAKNAGAPGWTPAAGSAADGAGAWAATSGYPTTSTHPTPPIYPTPSATTSDTAPPAATRPTWAAAPGPAWVPPPVVVPARSGPGATTVGAVFGVTALTAAVLLGLSRTGAYDGPVALPAIAAFIGLCGVGIVVAGLRGRTSGSLSFWAVIACLFALPTAGLQQVDLDWGDATRVGVGDATFTPANVSSAEDGYVMGAGNWTIDLRELPAAWSGAVEIPASFGAGELEVIVPEGTAWEADVALLAGKVSVHDSDGEVRKTQDGVLHPGLTFASADVEAGATPTVVLDLQGGAGEIRIIEEES
ncbi:hypothetical protein GCM10011331_05040 [Flavimobilis marinus]|uniref:Phage shock protein C (PspC) family protein n=1 Tax=Flavimobilis marinus TaxID=285351 RepID=A0A1I2DBU3_9MICO|nr:PspC domain-containing protein [Flavimobilis marinus]GHG45567.1 hypothetical protein GCM10011331_05040 [Flavimobilis marinus]SFE77994.1 phage shock protein C (PspC) family protein [Flavimobilis marinus]